MLFRDVEIGAVFFDNTTGEYYKKLSADVSVVWEFDEDRVHLYSDSRYKELQTIEAAFPQDHEVAEPE